MVTVNGTKTLILHSDKRSLNRVIELVNKLTGTLHVGGGLVET